MTRILLTTCFWSAEALILKFQCYICLLVILFICLCIYRTRADLGFIEKSFETSCLQGRHGGKLCGPNVPFSMIGKEHSNDHDGGGGDGNDNNNKKKCSPVTL